MKRAARAGAARDTNASIPLARDNSSGIPIKVRDLRRVAFGSKRAEFIVELDAVTLEADLFILDNGDRFVAPASVRDRYSGQWRRTAKFDDAFAADVLEVVLMRLGADA
jgi:hypothetical protein